MAGGSWSLPRTVPGKTLSGRGNSPATPVIREFDTAIRRMIYTGNAIESIYSSV